MMFGNKYLWFGYHSDCLCDPTVRPSNGHSNFEDLSKSVWVGNVNQMVKEAELKKIFSTLVIKTDFIFCIPLNIF